MCSSILQPSAHTHTNTAPTMNFSCPQHRKSCLLCKFQCEVQTIFLPQKEQRVMRLSHQIPFYLPPFSLISFRSGIVFPFLFN